MENIKFINRNQELKKIEEMKKGNFFFVLKGRRRIGKTMLLKKAFPEAIYIFVWPDKSISWIIERICKDNNLPTFINFRDLINYILDKNRIIIIDEFQNFTNIDKSVYGEMQNLIDERKEKNLFLKIAVAGSSYSLMNKVFNDSASPLYGRRTEEFTVENLPIKDLFLEFNLDLEDFIKLWSIFEGIPYYYELINFKISPQKNIKELIMSKEAKLQDEGKAILSIEFGKDSKTYSTVLSTISEGKTKLNEISSLFNNKKNEVIKYLNILRKEFKLVVKRTPIIDDPRKSKEGRYEIIDNFLSFWFLFIDKYRDYIEQERFEELIKIFDDKYSKFIGIKFEKFIIKLINNKIIFPNNEFSKIGAQWGKFKAEKDKNQYEIDILAINEKNKNILFGECKWKEKINSKEIIVELMKKSYYVNWNNKERKESFAIFAKSFSKKITEFNGKKVYCFDLEDIEKMIKK